MCRMSMRGNMNTRSIIITLRRAIKKKFTKTTRIHTSNTVITRNTSMQTMDTKSMKSTVTIITIIIIITMRMRAKRRTMIITNIIKIIRTSPLHIICAKLQTPLS